MILNLTNVLNYFDLNFQFDRIVIVHQMQTFPSLLLKVLYRQKVLLHIALSDHDKNV